ncbi:Rab family GTPase [Aliikangiella sp. G2MR2-5]|uniref:Rab family GTPase n=1 Tax=Aliikangiella sp. G2MR2-5 TaxID=2788943 RepID=UPI00352C178F
MRLSKKICMVGAFAVGKTSLVRRFVDSIFSEKYHTTIGVKIDKRQVELHENSVQLILWDIEGVDIFTDLNASYLRGASGIILVIDGTRPATLDTAKELISLIENTISDYRIVVLFNKHDLEQEWAMPAALTDSLNIDKDSIFFTSAKTGENVEEAFQHLTELICPPEVVDK